MLLGEHEYKIDEKGRIALPPKYRWKFREGGVLSPGLEKCIKIYPLHHWKKIAEGLSSPPLERTKERRLNRFIFGTAFEFELDGQGRITLPIPLRRYAGIESLAVILGVNTHLELWSKESWEAERNLLNEQAWQIVESLETYR